MFVEINLLKTKHGVLARYEKGENVEAVGALHKKRTFSILLIVVLLGVLAGLQYGERLFSPIQGPLMKSLDYTLQLIPNIMQDLKGEEEEEQIENVEDFFEVADEGMHMKTPDEDAPAAVVVTEKETVSEPTPPPPAPAPVKKVVETKKEPEPQPVVQEKKPAPVKVAKKTVAPPKISTYVNAGSYLLKDNITRLRNAGKKQGFSVTVKTVYRMLPNYSLFIGNLQNPGKVEVVERDLKKRDIPFIVTKKNDGSFDVYTEYTPLKFLVDKQDAALREGGYVTKVTKKNKKTPLNKILVGPLAENEVSKVVAYLKKSGFPAQVVKE